METLAYPIFLFDHLGKKPGGIFSGLSVTLLNFRDSVSQSGCVIFVRLILVSNREFAECLEGLRNFVYGQNRGSGARGTVFKSALEGNKRILMNYSRSGLSFF